MIQALIFDFDGLLVDTETPAFESWRALYAEYGHELTLELWQGALGTSHGFDALAHLAALAAQPIRSAGAAGAAHGGQARAERRAAAAAGRARDTWPGRALGLPCAVASSSGRDWVLGWLRHHGIEAAFACIRTADDVARTKPAPDLFLSAAACLGVPPASCLVFEDSPNGILAARAAGMRCVAVPGAITRRLALPRADLLIDSLDALPLADILARIIRMAAGVWRAAQ